MTKLSDETYVPVSRGLLKHLANMTSNELKVYMYLLMRASANGHAKGTIACPIELIANDLDIHYMTVYKAIQSLKPKYIKYKPAKNQYNTTRFQVQKYKNVKDFALSHKTKSVTKSEVKANKERGKSEVKAQSSDQQKETPKKLREVIRSNKKDIETIYLYYCTKIKQLRKLTLQRKQKIESRLEDFSVANLKKAIDNLSTSDWHMGRDQKTGGTKYNALEWLFHSYERTEKFVDMEPKVSEGKKRDPDYARADGLKNWEYGELQKIRNAGQYEGIWSEEKWAKEGSDKAWKELEKLKASLTPPQP